MSARLLINILVFGIFYSDTVLSFETTDIRPLHRQQLLGMISIRAVAFNDKAACARAKQLYEAASSDARVLERAIFVSNFRSEVERALGRRLSDEDLRTLAEQARAEAHRWYKYMQGPEHGCG